MAVFTSTYATVLVSCNFLPNFMPNTLRKVFLSVNITPLFWQVLKPHAGRMMEVSDVHQQWQNPNLLGYTFQVPLGCRCTFNMFFSSMICLAKGNKSPFAESRVSGQRSPGVTRNALVSGQSAVLVSALKGAPCSATVLVLKYRPFIFLSAELFPLDDVLKAPEGEGKEKPLSHLLWDSLHVSEVQGF